MALIKFLLAIGILFLAMNWVTRVAVEFAQAVFKERQDQLTFLLVAVLVESLVFSFIFSVVLFSP